MSSTKIKNFLTVRKLLAACGLSLLIVIKLTGVLSAQTVAHGYGSDQVLQRGMIVGTTKSDTTKVESLDTSGLNRILGVVVSPNDSNITISSNNQNVFVATSGRYDVLVSDQQGAINSTDYITLSSLSGVGMKATADEPTVLGQAAQAFDGKQNVLSTTQAIDKSGKQKTIHIGRVAVEIAVSKNPLARSNGAPAILNRAGTAIAGKTVSAVRLYLGAIIFIIGTIIAGSILYAGISSGIISIGRNPLSKKSILKSVVGASFASIVIFLISIIGVYLLLKL